MILNMLVRVNKLHAMPISEILPKNPTHGGLSIQGTTIPRPNKSTSTCYPSFLARSEYVRSISAAPIFHYVSRKRPEHTATTKYGVLYLSIRTSYGYTGDQGRTTCSLPRLHFAIAIVNEDPPDQCRADADNKMRDFDPLYFVCM